MPATPNRRFETEERDGTTIVTFLDPLIDEQNSWIIKKQVAELLDEPTQPRLLLDFARVKFLSSAALGAMLSLQKKAKKRGVAIGLCGLTPQLEEVIQATGLDQIFEVKSSR